MLHGVELGSNIMRATEYFVSLLESVVLNGWYNVKINSEKLVGTTLYRLSNILSKVLLTFYVTFSFVPSDNLTKQGR
jgi:hypothetical protein